MHSLRARLHATYAKACLMQFTLTSNVPISLWVEFILFFLVSDKFAHGVSHFCLCFLFTRDLLPCLFRSDIEL